MQNVVRNSRWQYDFKIYVNCAKASTKNLPKMRAASSATRGRVAGHVPSAVAPKKKKNWLVFSKKFLVMQCANPLYKEIV